MRKYQTIKGRKKIVEFKDIEVEVLSDEMAFKLIEVTRLFEHFSLNDEHKKAVIAVLNGKRLTKAMMVRLYDISYRICSVGERHGHPWNENIKWWNQDEVKHQLKINILQWLEFMSREELDQIDHASNSTLGEYIEARFNEPYYARAISTAPVDRRDQIISNLSKFFTRQYTAIWREYIENGVSDDLVNKYTAQGGSDYVS